mmetsp:Transcript_97418/g.254032  ORF Transcript_97418/g.254032 Transcript_97418/m.254032 type:complete len:266 (+) Transcript_97418:1228-2025(+)
MVHAPAILLQLLGLPCQHLVQNRAALNPVARDRLTVEHVAQSAARELAVARQQPRHVADVDREGRRLTSSADHDGHVLRRQDGAGELHAAPAAAPPSGVVADSAGACVLADRRQDQHQQTSLEVRRDGVHGLGCLPHFRRSGRRADLRNAAVVDPDVHGRELGPILGRDARPGLERPREPMVVDVGHLSGHQPLQVQLQGDVVLVVRIRLGVREPLVRDAEDPHVARPLRQGARAQEVAVVHQLTHLQEVGHRDRIHRILRIEGL